MTIKEVIESVKAQDAPDEASRISQRDVTVELEHAFELAGYHLKHDGLLIAVEV